jgi:hypothetical protein
LTLQRDLDFISQRWATVELPKEKQYLLKYFDTDLQAALVKYVHVYGTTDNFTDHTGIPCQPRYLKALYNRLQRLEAAHRQAKSSLDEDSLKTLALIESGKYKL